MRWDSLYNSLLCIFKKVSCNFYKLRFKKENSQLITFTAFDWSSLQLPATRVSHISLSFPHKSTSFSLALYWICSGRTSTAFRSNDEISVLNSFDMVDHSLLETPEKTHSKGLSLHRCLQSPSLVVSLLFHQTSHISLAGSSSSLKPLQIVNSQDLSLIKLYVADLLNDTSSLNFSLNYTLIQLLTLNI